MRHSRRRSGPVLLWLLKKSKLIMCVVCVVCSVFCVFCVLCVLCLAYSLKNKNKIKPTAGLWLGLTFFYVVLIFSKNTDRAAKNSTM